MTAVKPLLAYQRVPAVTSGDNPGYGWHLILDLHGCDPERINDAERLRRWVIGLVDVIGMDRYGPPIIDTFAHDDPVTAGYTVVQLITTSSITAHFSPYRRTAHIDVFSCRPFNPRSVTVNCEVAFAATEPGRSLFLGRG